MPQDYTLARLLANNAQWAQDVSAQDPDFFPSLAPSQSPKVSPFVLFCMPPHRTCVYLSMSPGARRHATNTASSALHEALAAPGMAFEIATGGR